MKESNYYMDFPTRFIGKLTNQPSKVHKLLKKLIKSVPSFTKKYTNSNMNEYLHSSSHSFILSQMKEIYSACQTLNLPTTTNIK